MPLRAWIAAVAISLVICSQTRAASVVTATVERADDGFAIQFSVDIDAPLAGVRELIGDIRNLAKLSPSTVSSETLQPGTSLNDESSTWVQVVLRPCVLVFCKTLNKVSRVVPVTDDFTRYEVIRQHSSFDVADEQLRLEDRSGITRMTYQARLVPDFFVPPVIGAWLVRRVIVSEMTEAAQRAEQMLGRESKP